MARPQFGIAQSGKARHRPLGLETHGDSRGVLSQPGTFPSGRGHSTPSGTGFLSPNAQAVPRRKRMHPHAQDVPVETGRPGLVSVQCRPVPGQCQASTGPVPNSARSAPEALTQRPI